MAVAVIEDAPLAIMEARLRMVEEREGRLHHGMKAELDTEKEHRQQAELRVEELATVLQKFLDTQGGDTLAAPADQKRLTKEALHLSAPEDVGDSKSQNSAFDTLIDPSGTYRTLEAMTKDIEEYEFDTKDIPADMWGVAIMTLTRDLGDIFSGSNCGKHLVRFLYSFFCAILNLALQLVLLWYVYRFVVGDSVWHIQGNYAQFHVQAFGKDQKFNQTAWRNLDTGLRDGLCSAVLTKPLFLGIILFLWVGRMMGEFKACNRLLWDVANLSAVPSEASSYQCIVEREGNHQVIGMKCGTRFLIYTLVVIPKFCICILLTVIGLQWLTATEGFAALILNALVLGFIVDIDENILKFFLPQRCKTALEATKFAYPSKGSKSDEVLLHEMVHDYVRNVLYLGLAIAVTYVYITYLQQVLPWFRHDIHENCGHWFVNRFVPKCTPFMHGCFPFGSGAKPPHHISYNEMLPHS